MTMRHEKMTGREWFSSRSSYQQGALLALAGMEIVLTAKTLLDLARRPSEQIRGPKIAWLLASAVQPFGPIVYLTHGRSPRR